MLYEAMKIVRQYDIQLQNMEKYRLRSISENSYDDTEKAINLMEIVDIKDLVKLCLKQDKQKDYDICTNIFLNNDVKKCFFGKLLEELTFATEDYDSDLVFDNFCMKNQQHNLGIQNNQPQIIKRWLFNYDFDIGLVLLKIEESKFNIALTEEEFYQSEWNLDLRGKLFSVLDDLECEDMPWKYFEVNNTQYLTIKLKYRKNNLWGERNSLYYKNHAQIMLLLPHFICDNNIKTKDHIFKARLKAMIWYEPSHRRYSTFINIEDDTWVEFTDTKLNEYRSLELVYRQLITKSLFPVLISYQKTDEFFFSQDKKATDIALHYYKEVKQSIYPPLSSLDQNPAPKKHKNQEAEEEEELKVQIIDNKEQLFDPLLISRQNNQFNSNITTNLLETAPSTHPAKSMLYQSNKPSIHYRLESETNTVPIKGSKDKRKPKKTSSYLNDAISDAQQPKGFWNRLKAKIKKGCWGSQN